MYLSYKGIFKVGRYLDEKLNEVHEKSVKNYEYKPPRKLYAEWVSKWNQFPYKLHISTGFYMSFGILGLSSPIIFFSDIANEFSLLKQKFFTTECCKIVRGTYRGLFAMSFIVGLATMGLIGGFLCIFGAIECIKEIQEKD